MRQFLMFTAVVIAFLAAKSPAEASWWKLHNTRSSGNYALVQPRSGGFLLGEVSTGGCTGRSGGFLLGEVTTGGCMGRSGGLVSSGRYVWVSPAPLSGCLGSGSFLSGGYGCSGGLTAPQTNPVPPARNTSSDELDRRIARWDGGSAAVTETVKGTSGTVTVQVEVKVTVNGVEVGTGGTTPTVDVLESLKKAYSEDGGEVKNSTSRKNLAAVWRIMAVRVKTDTNLMTVKDVIENARGMITFQPKDAIEKTRRAIQAHQSKLLSDHTGKTITDTTDLSTIPLNEALRDKLAALYEKVANALNSSV